MTERPELRKLEERAHLDRLAKYGLEPKDYERLWEWHEGLCAICGNAAKHIDHDHETGEVRGLLCPACNLGLGQFRDSVELLNKATSYLQFPPAPECFRGAWR